ncbi:MAG: TetR family transcriptional regulator [Hamadaea sp.]|nr:TetR family transcriptional regulator [Hamadaea sp.]
MPDSRSDSPASPSLRERKKAKTRKALQEAAMRLIREQGYDATTVDQIAAAAEVSPATFFRYFPTKEDVIIQDEYDPMFVERWHELPPTGTPIQRIREVIRSTFSGLPQQEIDAIRERTTLMYSTPQVKARVWDNWLNTQHLFDDLIGRHLGLPAEHPRVRATTGAMMGAILAVFETWIADPAKDLAELVDEALSYLEAGL